MSRKLKDSGIPWIGMIPEEWEVNRFKYLFALGKGLNITKADLTEEGIAVVNYGQVHSKLNHGTGIFPEIIKYVPKKYLETDSNCLVNEGDFVFADTSEDVAGCGNCCYVDKPMVIFAGYHSITAKSRTHQNNKYLAYLFQTVGWRAQIHSQVSGIKVYSVSQSLLGNVFVISPSIEEQTQIASWLDVKCGEVDELIEVEEKMVLELEAYRQALITETVTHGLKLDVEMCTCRNPWIFEIPKHWKQDKVLRTFEYFGSGTTPKGGAYLVDEGGIPWINSGELNFGYLMKVKKSLDPKALEDLPALKVYPIDSIIIAMYGASIGKIAISKIEGCTNQACLSLVRNRKDTDLKYLFYQLYSFKDKWMELSFGGTQPNINADNIKQTWLALPPLSEQQGIVSYLDGKCAEIDELISVKREKIETLKQYRQSLIFEAVTGKIEIPQPQ
ncbi:MAG: restriction endonuclease subunit S [Bacteroidales bacterium]|nr:restriction endonuclease subunit S [Bacteroidales bacterium]